MFKNKIIWATKKEIENNLHIILKDETTINIFVDGKKTKTMSDTMMAIGDQVMEDGPLYEDYLFAQAVDHLYDIFAAEDKNKFLYQYNIIIYNWKYHNVNWNRFYRDGTPIPRLNEDGLYDVIEVYEDVISLFGSSFFDQWQRRKSIDIYICEEDINEEEIKSRVNNPSKEAVWKSYCDTINSLNN